MTAYAVVVVIALAALSARGFTGAAEWVAAGLFVVGAGFELAYLVRRKGDRVMPHRRRLDNVVRAQWCGIAAVGVAVAAAFHAAGYAPLSEAATFVQTLVIGVVVAAPTIYVSSLVDWYWILPKVSGMTGLAPCERPAEERWAGVTGIWFFHRAVATAVVTGVLAAVPGYMAGSTSAGGAASAGWVLLGSALAIGYNSVNTGLRTAFAYAFNPPVHVGDIIRVRDEPEDREMKNAYVVDVSVQGLKYKLVPAGPVPKPRFSQKGRPLSMEEVGKARRVSEPRPPCNGMERCQAINWYCLRNAQANGTVDEDGGEPVSWSP